MIQVNLLPDVKREYLKAQQMKHVVVVGAVLLSLASVAVLVLMFVYVQVVQPAFRSSIQKDIDQGVTQLNTKKSNNNAIKIVTVQGALERLPGLQDTKPITSNLFSYLTGFTPKNVDYSSVQINLSANTLKLNGEATSNQLVNVLANNLKSAKFTYTKGENQNTLAPFSAVVFTSLSNTEQSDTTKPVNFELSLSFNAIIFDQAISKQTLSVNASSEDLILPSAQPFSNTNKSSGSAQ